MSDATDSVVVVHGKVRRGVWLPDQLHECENCAKRADWCLLSGGGRETFLCSNCRPLVGEPHPPTGPDGRAYVTLAEARSVIAKGGVACDLRAAERYERDIARWQRQTRKHGFKRVQADPRKRAHISLWSPYSN